MPLIELPHTRGCLVCGHDNPHGLHLHLDVNPDTGDVACDYTPAAAHMGFDGIVHGGLLATVLDEAMVWAATWSGKRFCVCGELNVRFRRSVAIGQSLTVAARIVSVRSRLIETEASMRDTSGVVFVEATGKYVPVPADRNRDFVATLVAEPGTAQAFGALQKSGA